MFVPQILCRLDEYLRFYKHFCYGQYLSEVPHVRGIFRKDDKSGCEFCIDSREVTWKYEEFYADFNGTILKEKQCVKEKL